jgi:hypothetical protein
MNTTPQVAGNTARFNLEHTFGRPRSWRAWWASVRVPTLVVLCLMLIIFGVLYYRATYVSGTELNVSNWEVRTFSYRRDPFTDYQLTGVMHRATNHLSLWSANPLNSGSSLDAAIQQHLRSASKPAPRWDLIELNDHGLSTGGASILVDLLEARDSEYSLFWSVWSKAEPAKAAVLWPATQDLAAVGLYAYIPNLFQLAIADLDAGRFASLVHARVADACRSQELRLIEVGETQAAHAVKLLGAKYVALPEAD